MWQQVHSKMQEGVTPLPAEVLNRAFMRKAEEGPKRKSSTSRVASRRLPRDRALTADLIHVHFTRQGIMCPEQLRWAVGRRRGQPSSEDREASRSQVPRLESLPLSGDVLEGLLGLLQIAKGQEERLHEPSVEATAPAEEFMRGLLIAPLSVLLPRVEMALNMSRFSDEVTRLERELRLGINTMETVMKSESLPLLFEGVLLLGNYVNSNCKPLSSAVGVTLESVAKLAHTRCLPSLTGASLGKGKGPQHALDLLVAHLQEANEAFAERLADRKSVV